MNTNIKKRPTITTAEPCPVCRDDARVTHGYEDRSGPVHLWHCPTCGESLAAVCYDCPDCDAFHPAALSGTGREKG